MDSEGMKEIIRCCRKGVDFYDRGIAKRIDTGINGARWHDYWEERIARCIVELDGLRTELERLKELYGRRLDEIAGQSATIEKMINEKCCLSDDVTPNQAIALLESDVERARAALRECANYTTEGCEMCKANSDIAIEALK